MPLIKSSSKEAFSKNVSAERHAGRPIKQALAIAFDVKRRAKRAMGGGVGSRTVNRAMSGATHAGPILSTVGGRTDHLPMAVRAGSYVLPADHVSSLGQGNTANGLTVLNDMFTKGPYGISASKITGGSGPPRGKRAAGGMVDQDVPIYAAGGEYVIPPEIVAAIGNGDMKAGHAILDKWVLSNRKKHINTLRKLPKPAKK